MKCQVVLLLLHFLISAADPSFVSADKLGSIGRRDDHVTRLLPRMLRTARSASASRRLSSDGDEALSSKPSSSASSRSSSLDLARTRTAPINIASRRPSVQAQAERSQFSPKTPGPRTPTKLNRSSPSSPNLTLGMTSSALSSELDSPGSRLGPIATPRRKISSRLSNTDAGTAQSAGSTNPFGHPTASSSMARTASARSEQKPKPRTESVEQVAARIADEMKDSKPARELNYPQEKAPSTRPITRRRRRIPASSIYGASGPSKPMVFGSTPFGAAAVQARPLWDEPERSTKAVLGCTNCMIM